MKVTNLGLSDKTAREYAAIPAIGDISAVYRDDHGRPVYSKSGETLYKPINTSIEQLKSFSTTLGNVISEATTAITTLPNDEAEITKLAQERYDADVKEMKDRLSLVE